MDGFMLKHSPAAAGEGRLGPPLGFLVLCVNWMQILFKSTCVCLRKGVELLFPRVYFVQSKVCRVGLGQQGLGSSPSPRACRVPWLPWVSASSWLGWPKKRLSSSALSSELCQYCCGFVAPSQGRAPGRAGAARACAQLLLCAPSAIVCPCLSEGLRWGASRELCCAAPRGLGDFGSETQV